MNNPIHILSLGAGVQSTTMALMAGLGEISPLPHSAIFADTKDEPSIVYEHVENLKKVIPFPIITVCKGDLMKDNLLVKTSGKTGLLYLNGKIPAFTLQPDGKAGLLGRMCTMDYKIQPIRRKCREIIGKEVMNQWRKTHKVALKALASSVKDKKIPRNQEAWDECQNDALVHMWIGISSDEWLRAKPSAEPWIKNVFPLLDKKVSRSMCNLWLVQNGYPIPPRSACKKCPFHGDEEWAKQTKEEFAESVAYEKKLQEAAAMVPRLTGIPYLHESCKPLGTIDFKDLVAKGYAQLDLFGTECEGLCGV